jgi:putative peptide zinc metalloprotease protein
MGIAFIVFFPRFYTDLTDAWRILDPRKRMMIDAAGILLELVAGGWAALIWWNTGPGLLHLVAYNVFAVATLNTIFINGNPAIRYDGYYLLMDFLRIDNLQQRGTREFQGWFRWIFFGIPREPQPQKIQPWQLHFLSIYAVLAFFYRIFLYTSIILIVYWKFTKVLGIVLLLLEVYLLFILPLANEIKALYLLRHRYRVLQVSISAAILAGIAAIFLIPLPWTLTMPCEAKPASRMVAVADQEGFLKTIHVADGQAVKAGQRLFSLENPFDEWQEKQDAILARHLETEAHQLGVDPQKIGISQVKLKQLATVKGRLDEARRRQALLVISATIDGRIAIADRYLSPGKWIKAGEPLAEVYNPDGVEIDAFVHETDLRFIKAGGTVAIRLPDELRVRHGVVRRIVPAAVADLYASPLLDLSKGPIATIPGQTPIKLRDAYYRINIIPDQGSAIQPGRSGEVIAVRPTSIASHLYAIVLNLLQKELSF